MNWREQARCAGEDTEMFFNSRPDVAAIICGRCPVIAQCHDFATRNRIPFGVFGGEMAPVRRARLGISDDEAIGDAA